LYSVRTRRRLENAGLTGSPQILWSDHGWKNE
jgi:hypothetical protein